jgi:hypothetical protein
VQFVALDDARVDRFFAFVVVVDISYEDACLYREFAKG